MFAKKKKKWWWVSFVHEISLNFTDALNETDGINYEITLSRESCLWFIDKTISFNHILIKWSGSKQKYDVTWLSRVIWILALLYENIK